MGAYILSIAKGVKVYIMHYLTHTNIITTMANNTNYEIYDHRSVG